MGNCQLRVDLHDPTEGTLHTAMSRNHYLFRYPIGRGGFGKVWKVKYKQTRQIYALKEMSKDRVIAKKSVASVMNERRLLATLRHSFIVNMLFAFQDQANLYLVMNLMPGGDLRYHVGRYKRFTEEQTKFFVGCLLVALEYLHGNGIIHRDIKPENIVLDELGYARLTDFGIARLLSEDNSQDTSGTPGYMSPEVMCKMSHGIAVDFFALGVVTHEFMLGRRPYVGRNRKEVREAILAKQAVVTTRDVPVGWSEDAADFVTRLLQRKCSIRLGYNGCQEAMQHPWLHDVDWDQLKRKGVTSPFAPGDGDNFDQKFTAEGWKDEEEIRAMRLTDSMKQELFVGYHYDIRDEIDTQDAPSELSEKTFPLPCK